MSCKYILNLKVSVHLKMALVKECMFHVIIFPYFEECYLMKSIALVILAIIMGCWEWDGPWFNIKMSSYQYRKYHCGDKTVVRSSYLHNGISYIGKITSLYWIRALDSWWHCDMGTLLLALCEGNPPVTGASTSYWMNSQTGNGCQYGQQTRKQLDNDVISLGFSRKTIFNPCYCYHMERSQILIYNKHQVVSLITTQLLSPNYSQKAPHSVH